MIFSSTSRLCGFDLGSVVAEIVCHKSSLLLQVAAQGEAPMKSVAKMTSVTHLAMFIPTWNDNKTI